MLVGAIGIIWLIISLAFMLGFAYIIYVLAAKETGNMKLIGQVLTWIVVAGTVLTLIFGLWGGIAGRGAMMKSGYQKDMMKKYQGKQMTPEEMQKLIEKYKK